MDQSKQKDIETKQLLAKYDREFATRVKLKKAHWVIIVIGVALTIFHLYTAYRGVYPFTNSGADSSWYGTGIDFFALPGQKRLGTSPGSSMVRCAACLAGCVYKLLHRF